jgi:hypothetical protein
MMWATIVSLPFGFALMLGWLHLAAILITRIDIPGIAAMNRTVHD